MDIVKVLYFSLFLSILGFYFNWFFRFSYIFPRRYDDFMCLLIKHKDVFTEKSFYLNIESDYKNRVLPFFGPSEFSEFVVANDSLSIGDQRALVFSYEKLFLALASSVVDNFRTGDMFFPSTEYKVKSVLKLSLLSHSIVLLLLVLLFFLFFR